MFKKRESRVNVHHLVVESGNFTGREIKGGDVKVFSGFRIGQAPSSTHYPIPYGPGHGYKELIYINGNHGGVPRFERKGKKQPDIVKGLVDSVSIRESEAGRILEGKKLGFSLRAIQATRAAVADIAIVSFFHYNFPDAGSSQGRVPVLGVSNGQVLGSGNFFDRDDENQSGCMMVFALQEGGSFDFVYSVPEALGYCCLRAEFGVEKDTKLEEYPELDFALAPRPKLQVLPTHNPAMNLAAIR